jgi:RimJ/RimL family protein N-acetyltransferase
MRHGDRQGRPPGLRTSAGSRAGIVSCRLVSTPFVPDDFELPLELATDRFRLEPLGPEHNERDHEAWMSSIDHIRATPGFPNGNWPTEMSAEQNLADLVQHAADFAARTGFTYSVLDGDEVIGCVYLYPTIDGEHDVVARSWVRTSRAEMDVVLRETVSSWLTDAWPFRRPLYDRRR